MFWEIKKIIFILLIIPLIIPFNVSAIWDVRTGSASEVTSESAILSGSLVPESEITSGYFRYSSKVSFPPVFCNDIYGSDMQSTNEINLGNGSFPKTFTANISQLSSDTTYYYCAVGSNKNEIKYGNVRQFTTGFSSSETMSVNTENALVIDSTSAYLNGFYNTSVPAVTWFEYRRAPQNSSLERNSQNELGSTWKKVGEKNRNGNTNGNFNHIITGLTKNSTYQFKAGIKGSSGINIIYGNPLTFTTLSNDGSSYGEIPFYSGNDNSGNDNNNLNNLTIGQSAIPPVDAVVRYHEGIEHVLVRQIMANSQLAHLYGYKDGEDLQLFAWNLADIFARAFGYVAPGGKEIRVSPPDIAAYRLELNNGVLTIYEYYDGVIVNIQTMTSSLRSTYGYEYYYQKR